MTTAYVLYAVEGDTGPDLYTTWVGQDLSLLTGLSFILRTPDGGKITRAAVIDDAANGKFHVVWQPGDISQGDHKVEISVIDGGGYAKRFPSQTPIILRARPQV